MKTNNAQATWRPQRAKSFETGLANLIAREFPRFGGPKVIHLFIQEIKSLIEQFYPSTERAAKGSIVWVGVDATDFPARHKSMAQTRLKACILPLVTDEDIQYIETHPGRRRMKLLQMRIVRLLQSSYNQGVLLSYPEVALICLCSEATVSNLVKEYEEEHQVSLPCRATIHDLGSKLTHKALICKKRYLDKLSISEIAKQVYHQPESVDRYLKDYERVIFCLNNQMDPQQIAFSTKMSLSLVKQYIEIHNMIKNAKK